MINMPFCAKCHNAETTVEWNDRGNYGVHRLCGCKELTQEEWTEGWKPEATQGLHYQHNCPILKDKNK